MNFSGDSGYEDEEILHLFIIYIFRYNAAYCIFYLLGCGTLLPWNFFITANDVSDFMLSACAENRVEILTSMLGLRFYIN